MRFFVSHHATEQYSLIPYTDREIVKAVRHFFPDARSHLFGRDDAADARQFLAMKQACDTGEPMFSLDTTGQIPFHSLPFSAERNKLIYLSDAPFGSFTLLRAMPEGSYVGYSDRRFLEFHQDSGLPIRPVFLPHGGPVTVDRGKDPGDRALPVAFIGKVENPEPSGQFDHAALGGDPALLALFRQAADLSRDSGEEIYRAYRSTCLGRGENPMAVLPREAMCEVLWAMQHWVEAHRRLEVLRGFADRPIDIFGPVDQAIPGVTDRGHRFHGPIQGKQALQVLQETRILLNPVFVLAGGGHERIWFALANGCLPLTDPSRFVEESFTDGESLLFIDYADPSGSAEKAWAMAQAPDRIREMLDRAVPIYEAGHTWISRLREAFRQIPELTPYAAD
ncbi:glycosyltransferase [Hwanghaeella sp.]|uniref:glycosyltransferase n=1 Tax=Hwanghaeella sp. TaxID=2605943 RepID=UPI003CCC309A